ncbi:MAG: hypothetical protein NZM04_00475 [Methylacidiphilales bacterium]|nr:hypothetical protein [Candidatus Methylacidiphilales bacterium]
MPRPKTTRQLLPGWFSVQTHAPPPNQQLRVWTRLLNGLELELHATFDPHHGWDFPVGWKLAIAQVLYWQPVGIPYVEIPIPPPWCPQLPEPPTYPDLRLTDGKKHYVLSRRCLQHWNLLPHAKTIWAIYGGQQPAHADIPKDWYPPQPEHWRTLVPAAARTAYLTLCAQLYLAATRPAPHHAHLARLSPQLLSLYQKLL